ncbi:MAG: tyrosine-type recombinase/integrase [Bryobacteraceae bacterium]
MIVDEARSFTSQRLCRSVDLQGNRITKSGKAHVIPLNLHPEMRAFMEMALAARDAQCPYLFQYRGKQLKSIRTAFENARQEAGLGGQEGSDGSVRIIFHDTRRSAATHMVDGAGLDPEEAMEMTGHLTRSMFERYRIGKKSKAVAAGRKVAEFNQRSGKFANEFANETSGQVSRRVS